MILEFSIANFLSFKDKVTFSMLANATNGLDDNYIISNDRRILKTNAIYGANASGKTNLFKILTIVISMLRSSNIVNINAKLPIVPFKFDKNTINKPSEFEIKFIVDDVRYVYGFIADTNQIHEEYLYGYYTNQPTKIFERLKDDIEYTDEEKQYIKPLLGKTPSNKLFLTTANTFNYSKVTPAFDWLSYSIDSYGFNQDDNSALESLYLDELSGDNSAKLFTLKLLKQADLNIKDFIINRTIIPQGTSGNINLDPNSFVRINPTTDSYIYSISFYHPADNGDNVSLPFGAESLGTQQLFRISVVLNKVMKNGSVMIVDELDESLHPFLVKMLVDLFRNPEVNTCGAQLIFTSHDTNQLNLDYFRRDQIYFTSKDYNKGESELYALSDYSVRKDENIRKAYLLGRYGAIPNIETEELIV